MKKVNQMLGKAKSKFTQFFKAEYSNFRKKGAKLYLCELSEKIDLFVKRIENNNFVIRAKSVLDKTNVKTEEIVLSSRRLYRRYVVRARKSVTKDYRYRCLMLRLIYQYDSVVIELKKEIDTQNTNTGSCNIDYTNYKRRLMYLVKAQRKLENKNKEQVFYLINTYTHITQYSLENRYGIV